MKVGVFTLMTALLFALPVWAGTNPCVGPDTDSDGIADVCDNCTLKANASQTDADSDYCGNVCDGDFNQDGTTAIADFSSLATAYGTSSAVHDIAPDPRDYIVAIQDFSNFATMYGGPPGPGLPQCCPPAE